MNTGTIQLPKQREQSQHEAGLAASGLFYRRVCVLCACIGLPTVLLSLCGANGGTAIGFGLIFGSQIPLHCPSLQPK